MPYTAHIPYQAPGFIFQGFRDLGQGIGGGITSASELLRKQKEDQGQADTIFQEYLKTQKFSDDPTAHKEMAATQERKFNDLSPSAQKGVAAGIIQNWLQQYHVEQIKNMQSEAATRAQLAPAQVANLQSEAALRAARVEAMQNKTPVLPGVVPGAPPGYTAATTPKGGFTYLRDPADKSAKEDTPEQLNKDIRAATGHDIGDWLNAGNRREEGDLVVADIMKQVVPGFGNPIQQTMRIPKSQYGAFVQRWKNLQAKAAAATGGAAVLTPNASAGAGTAAGIVPDIVQPPPAATPTPTPTPAPESGPERFMRAIVRNQPRPTATPTLDAITDQISRAKPVVKAAPKATPAPAMSTRDQAMAILQAQGKLVSEETIATTIKRIEALKKGQ